MKKTEKLQIMHDFFFFSWLGAFTLSKVEGWLMEMSLYVRT